MLCLLASLASASETTDAIAASIDAYNAHARFRIPRLTTAQLQRLEAGKSVKIRETGATRNDPQRAIGLKLANESKERLFVAASDPHLAALDTIYDAQLDDDSGYPKIWYQYLDLPRLFHDRHWVVDVVDNIEMAKATNNLVWEHWWDLNPNGPALAKQAVANGQVRKVTTSMHDKAIYVPVNTGAWFYLGLPDGRTVLGFHATSVVGGSIPDKLVVDYAMLTLNKVLDGVIDRTAKASAHYDANHACLQGGDGQCLAPNP